MQKKTVFDVSFRR